MITRHTLYVSFYTLLSLILCVATPASLSAHVATQPMPQRVAMPQPPAKGGPGQQEIPDEAELERIVQEMQQTNKMIESEVQKIATQKDKDQAGAGKQFMDQFNNAVKVVEDKINDMDESELERLFEGLMSDDPSVMEDIVKDLVPEDLFTDEFDTTKETKPTPQDSPEKVKPKKVKVATDKQLKAIALLETVIKKTDSFVVKIQSSPELPAKIKRWGQRHTIDNWQKDFTWDAVKTHVERLTSTLRALKTRDPYTRKYRYIDDLIKDEALYNNLSKLATTLKDHETGVTVTPFSLKKNNKKARRASKKAIRSVISGYTEAIYVLNIPEALDKIIEKYEPRAQEIRKKRKRSRRTS